MNADSVTPRAAFRLPLSVGVLVAAIAVGLVVGGRAYYRHEVKNIRREKNAGLQAIAKLKVSQIVAWRKERLADARVSSSVTIRNEVLQWLMTPGDVELRPRLLACLSEIGTAYDYPNMCLAAPDGALLLALDPQVDELPDATKRLVVQAVDSREPAFGDVFRCSLCQAIHLDVVAPILDDTQRPVAALILRNDPESNLYPLIQSWPTSSKSAETLLVRKDGDNVLFLNTLRHTPAPALTLRIPMTRPDLPAALALGGQSGLFEGNDYRGIPVEADMRPIPGSPWSMITKMDLSEIHAEARYRGATIMIILAIAILMVGGGTVLLFSFRQRHIYKHLYRAERKEREAQEEIRATFYGIGDGVIAANAEGLVTRMNPVAEQLTGWRESEAVSQPIDEVFRIINEETRSPVQSSVGRVLREGAIVGLANHTLLIARDGSEWPIADSGAPIRVEPDGIVGVVLVFRDQTAERAAQTALHTREALSRSVLDAVGANVAVLDRHGVITLVNSAWKQFARKNGDISGGTATGVGVDYLAVTRTATGASTEGTVEALAGIQDVLAGGIPEFTVEYPCHSPDTQRWFMLRATPLAGEAGGVVLAHIDITARKQMENNLQASETRYRRLFESAKDGILILDADTGRIVDVNPFLVSLLGYSRAEFVGKYLWEIGLFKDIAASREAFLELQAKGYVRYENLPLEARDGHRIEVEFVSNVYLVNGHKVIQCNIRDITEHERARQQEEAANLEMRRHLDETRQSRQALLSMMEDQKRAEVEREHMRAQLQQAQKLESIGTLAGGVAHEINNPIMGIMNYAQLIVDKLGPDSPVSEFATEIGEETQRVATIVKNLLSFARQDKETHSSPARMCDIVESTLSLVSAVMRKDQITIETDVPDDLPQVRCRSQQIRQVVMNLFTNARDALNAKHPGYDPDKKIMIRARVVERGMGNGEQGSPRSDSRIPPSYVRLTVEDHGSGIPAAVRERIFEPFFTTKPRDKGTGLGLSISHGIVKDHGGVLSVESEPGRWTRFYVDLPVGNWSTESEANV